MAAPKREHPKRERAAALDKNGRPYQHPCPPGTEVLGFVPPNGYQVWCGAKTDEGYMRQGKTIRWYQNGKKEFEGDYVYDKKNGIWTKYTRRGRKKLDEMYVDGKVVKKIVYGRFGRPQAEIDPIKEEQAKAEKEAERQKQLQGRRERMWHKRYQSRDDG